MSHPDTCMRNTDTSLFNPSILKLNKREKKESIKRDKIWWGLIILAQVSQT